MEPPAGTQGSSDLFQTRVCVAKPETEAQKLPARQGGGLTGETEEARRTCEV